MDFGLQNLVVFLDLKKAFDTVDHQILVNKLEAYGVTDSAVKLLCSYLTTRKQKCQVNDILSSSRQICCGVPQGSILGPLLFLVYINDLPNCLDYTTPRMFADNTNLTASGKYLEEMEVRVTYDLSNVKKCLSANKLSLNVAKTEFMLIGSKPKFNSLHEQPKVTIGDEPIKRVYDSKTLGMRIDESLTWDKHTDDIAQKNLMCNTRYEEAKLHFNV